MKIRNLALLFALCFGAAHAQLLSVTATLTDTDGTVWANGTCSIQTYNTTGGPSYYNGVAIPTAPSCSINSSGVLSASLYNTGNLNPASSLYSFTIQSNTSAKASTFLSPVTASNMTSTLSALITAPRFNAAPTAFGYIDTEALSGQVGLTYYNVTTPAWRQCTIVTSGSCGTWVTVGGGGGSGDTITSPNSTITVGGTSTATTLDVANPFTGYPATPGVVFNTSTTASRNAVVADLIALWTGTCTGSAVLGGNGVCATISSALSAITGTTGTGIPFGSSGGLALDATYFHYDSPGSAGELFVPNFAVNQIFFAGTSTGWNFSTDGAAGDLQFYNYKSPAAYGLTICGNATKAFMIGYGNSTCTTKTLDVRDKTATTGATRVNIGLGAADSTSTVTEANEGTTKAAGYQSGDGSIGVTVTTCTSFKNGLCVAGT